MYRKFFGLAEDPFNLTPDSRFLYLSRKHREALANLIYGIQERKGFITLTGEIGSGKTTLCRALVNELDPKTTKLALILNPCLNEIELLQTINEDFGIAAESNSKRDLIKALNQFLLDENAAGHNVVLIIDEAQNLAIEVLEQIRMLSNIETETHKLIQIILMGQPELIDMLARPELEQLNQRISVRYHIYPLDEEDVAYYIRHRLFVAKAQIDIEFTPEALAFIYKFSGGVPRKINVLCDRCLLAAYAKVTYAIDDSIVRESIREIEGERARQAASEKMPAKSPVKIMNVVVLAAILTVVILVGVVLGINLARKGIQGTSEAEVAALQEKASEPSYKEGWNPKPPKPENSAAGSATPTYTPTPTPTKIPHRYYFDWEYDKNNICRVNNPQFAYTAAIITCLRLWNIEVELENFKRLDAAAVSRINLEGNEKLGLKKFFIDKDLVSAIRYDVPLILTFSSPPQGLSPAVVLTRVEGISCTIADPINGLKAISRKVLMEKISQCVVIYFDPLNLDTLLKGEESERVKKLQEFLKLKGYLRGEPSGIFDAATESGIKNFRRYYKIESLVLLDQETILMLSTRMVTLRPRLYSSGGQD